MQLTKTGSRHLLAWTLCFLQVAMSAKAAESHVVPLSELHQQAASAAETREANLSKTREFFSLPQVQSALKSANIDGAKVDRAMALLSDEELSRLAARADKAQVDLRAGVLTNQQLT